MLPQTHTWAKAEPTHASEMTKSRNIFFMTAKNQSLTINPSDNAV